MERLYISDLDGTLLQNDASLSDFARRGIHRILEAGIPFTIATARSLTSVREILTDLPLRLPLICSNGAYLTDYVKAGHRHARVLEHPVSHGILDLIKRHDLQSFMLSLENDRDLLFVERHRNEGIQWYKDNRMRAHDPRLSEIGDLREVIDFPVLCFNIIDRREPILTIREELDSKFDGSVALYAYEDFFHEDWYWLSIYHPFATKGMAIRTLCKDLNFEEEQLTVFGDNHNDLSMFELKGKAVAVENAKAELRNSASQIIGSNTADAVVRFILDENGIEF